MRNTPLYFKAQTVTIFLVLLSLYIYDKGFSGGSVVKNPHVNAGRMSSIPRSGRSPGEGNGNTLQFSSLGNPRGEQPSRLAGYSP